jgi:hypothetical protein
MLRLGLGKASRAFPATSDKILDAAFAVAGPGAMEDMLDVCRRWGDGLIRATKNLVTAPLRYSLCQGWNTSLKKDKRILDTKTTRRAPTLQSRAEPAL